MRSERRQRQRGACEQRRDADLAWAAGLVDGEGVVRFDDTPYLKVDSACLPTLERLARALGGMVRPNSGGTVKPIHRLALTGTSARIAMHRILPYLTEKADQVALVLSTRSGRRGVLMSDQERAHRHRVRSELARMKRVTWPHKG